MSDAFDPRDPTTRPLKARDLDFLIVEAQRLEEGPQKHAQRMFEQGVLGAARSIINLAHASTNEGIRFKAAVYVTDRVLGRVQDSKPTGLDENDPWSKLAAECVSELPPDEYDKLRDSVREAKAAPRDVKLQPYQEGTEEFEGDE